MKSKYCHADLFKDQYKQERCSFCMLVSKPKKTARIAYIGLFLILILCGFSSKENSSVVKFQHKIVDTCDIPLNDTAILQELIKDSCILPNVSIAQAKIESGNYTSKITFSNHNIFGIKFHKCKFVKNEKNGYANYTSYKNCIKCYCHIQTLYLDKIDGKYAESKDYIKLIKRI